MTLLLLVPWSARGGVAQVGEVVHQAALHAGAQPDQADFVEVKRPELAASQRVFKHMADEPGDAP